MNLVEAMILIGFGVPILFLGAMFVGFACAMQRKEAAKHG